MDWRKLLTQANAKANEAKAIFADDDGDYEKAQALMQEAEELKSRALGIKAVEEGYTVDAPPADDGVMTAKAIVLREQMLIAGFTEEQADTALKALDGITVPSPGMVTALTGPKKTFGQFLKAVRMHNHKELVKVFGSKLDQDEEVKQLLEGAGASGGYLVPTEFLAELLKVPETAAIVRPHARKIPMRRRTLTIPMLDTTATPAAYWDLQYFGGVMAYWTEEGVAKTETEPAFKQGELVAHKLAGYTQASDELLADDGIGLQALLLELFRGAITMREDFAFLRGTGTGMPLGILNSAALVTQDRATAGVISFNDLGRMVGKMLPSSYASAFWVVDITALPGLLNMVDGAGNAMFIPNALGGIQQGIPLTILGRPLLITEKLPTLGTTGDLILADWRYYLIGDRQMTTIAASEHFAFTSDLTTWRFVHRVDGHPWMDAPLYIDTTNTVSPFVALHADTTS